MNISRIKLILISLILALSVLSAGEPDGQALLDRVMDTMNPQQSRAIMTQTIVTSSGGSRELTYETWSYGTGEMSLMRYLEPSRVKGNALLMKDFTNKIWMYNQRTRRTRLLASSAKKQKFEGSDFSYEDMGSGDSWKSDFTPSNLGISQTRDENCYQLELKAKAGTDVSYSKMLCHVRVSDSFPIQIDYYDENGELLKILHLENIETVQNILTPMVMRMENVQDGTETSMKYVEIDYSVDLHPDFFSERNLGR